MDGCVDVRGGGEEDPDRGGRGGEGERERESFLMISGRRALPPSTSCVVCGQLVGRVKIDWVYSWSGLVLLNDGWLWDTLWYRVVLLGCSLLSSV